MLYALNWLLLHYLDLFFMIDAHFYSFKQKFSPFLLQSNWNDITDNFDDMVLKETLLRGIYAYGFEKPSAIQQRAIIPCIKGIEY